MLHSKVMLVCTDSKVMLMCTNSKCKFHEDSFPLGHNVWQGE